MRGERMNSAHSPHDKSIGSVHRTDVACSRGKRAECSIRFSRPAPTKEGAVHHVEKAIGGNAAGHARRASGYLVKIAWAENHDQHIRPIHGTVSPRNPHEIALMREIRRNVSSKF